MPVLLVFGIPECTKQEKLKVLSRGLREAVVGVEDLGLIGIKQVSVFFPRDMMKAGLGEEIIIFVEGLFATRGRTKEVLKDLAQRLGEKVKEYFPKSSVKCFVETFDLDASQTGFSGLIPDWKK